MTNYLVEWLKFEEGFRRRPYSDSVGVRTVGYGRNLIAHPIPNRNWATTPCTEAEAEGWLREELGKMYRKLSKHRPVINDIDPARSAAMLNMAYQLGVGGVLAFKLMWDAVEAGDWSSAARAARDSRWARQTRNRAKRVCRTLETGEWPAEARR